MDFSGAKHIARFLKLTAPEPVKTDVALPAPRPQPSPAEVLHSLVHTWAKDAPPAFGEHITKTIQDSHDLVVQARAAHAEASFWLGYEQAIRDVQTAFSQWSHPNAGTPTPSALQGGLNAEP